MKFNKRSLYHKLWIFVMFNIWAFAADAQKIPRSYIAYKTNETMTIDGKADESAWKKAPWTDDYIDIEGVVTPVYKTRMKMLWDSDYLYLMAELEEPHIWATLKERDTVIFYNNDFEVFIDPDGDTHNYYEYEMNAYNTFWDLFLTKPYRNGGKVLNSLDIQGIKSAVDIRGTLNDPSDIDEGWSVEIALPWKVITEAAKKNKVPENDFWRLNFSRVNWDFDLTDGIYSRKRDTNGKFLPEYNWVWSPQWVVNMHEPEHWGYVYFSSVEAGGPPVEFLIPQDDQIKWYMYELYRNMLHYKEETKKQIMHPTTILGKTIYPKLDRHKFGWSIWVESPFSGNTLLIREDGEFSSILKMQ